MQIQFWYCHSALVPASSPSLPPSPPSLPSLPPSLPPQIFSSLSEALAVGGFEAVVLMVPHELHEAMALQCLEAGKHILLEKPLAHSVAACERLVAAAEAAGTVVMVAENSCYWPEVCWVQGVYNYAALVEVGGSG